jgi:hypothetical protein
MVENREVAQHEKLGAEEIVFFLILIINNGKGGNHIWL